MFSGGVRPSSLVVANATTGAPSGRGFSIPNWFTDLGKEDAEVPGLIPGEPVAWQIKQLDFAKLTGSGATATPACFPSEREQVC